MTRPARERIERLRAALARQLAIRQGGALRSLAELEEAAREEPAYGVAGAALGLAEPAAAVPLLRRLLGDGSWLVAVEAAAALAVLGDRSGLAVLTGPARGATNSCIEAFHVHAALLLLGEAIPPPGRRPRSVFADLEALLDEASA